MVAVNSVGNRNEHVVPAAIARFVSAHQQQRHTAWIKCVKHAKRSPAMLDSKLAHVPVARSDDTGAVWERQIRPESFEEADRRSNRLLLGRAQAFPPHTEFIGVLNAPKHNFRGL